MPTTRDVKALEDAIRNVASIQTRCLTLEILRRYEDEMVKEDEEEQLKGSTEGGGTEEHHIQQPLIIVGNQKRWKPGIDSSSRI
jgi:hypothetical protein